MSVATIPPGQVEAAVLRASLDAIVARQALVVSLGQSALAGLEPADLCASGLATLLEALGADRGVALSVDGDERLRRESAIGLGVLAGHGEPAGEAQARMLQRTVDAGGLLLLAGDRLDAGDELFTQGMGCVLSVVLQGGRGATNGMLAVAARERHAIGPEDEGFARAIANVVGTAIARSRADEEVARLGLRDPLTGLANRPLFENRLEATRPSAGVPAARDPAAHRSGSAPRETLLSLGQAARALRVSTTTARRWADDGRLATTRTAGGHRRFDASDVRRLLAERGLPAVAPVDPPRRPIPALATFAEEHGAALCDLSWRGLYGDLQSGFFVDPDGVGAAERWIGALASAAVSANYELLHEATASLMRAAERGGTSLLERHLALERFGEATARSLSRRSCPREEIVAVRRLFAFLDQRQLAGAD